ncbi:DNA-binding protein c1d [Rhizophlyctis rosea]|uniref:Exosome complex protein n=1 Tax=Rhizophlyctis rosea TaxID=64517 RepID=A0AAD5S7K5_9FUNG|nr:DNA-binding protein c1d [Rhizophlyctis rosea]
MADDDNVMAELEVKLSAMETSLKQVKSLLNPLLATPLDQMRPKLEPLDRAKLEITTAFAINSLAFNFLKTEGVPPKNHQVKQEIDRIKVYWNKLSAAAGPNQKVDQKAATRFVNAALFQNDEVKAEIKKRKAAESASRLLDSLIQKPAPGERHQPAAPQDVEMINLEETDPGTPPGPSSSSTGKKKKKKNKKAKVTEEDTTTITPESTDAEASSIQSTPVATPQTSPQNKAGKRKLIELQDDAVVSSGTEGSEGQGKKKKKKGKKKKGGQGGGAAASPLGNPSQ